MGDREVDQQLVERAQRGDKRAFELLVLKYQRKLARLLSRVVRDAGEVEDVTQEAFIKAYRALPSLRGESAFYTWLYRIAINTAKTYLVAIRRLAPSWTGGDHEEAERGRLRSADGSADRGDGGGSLAAGGWRARRRSGRSRLPWPARARCRGNVGVLPRHRRFAARTVRSEGGLLGALLGAA